MLSALANKLSARVLAICNLSILGTEMQPKHYVHGNKTQPKHIGDKMQPKHIKIRTMQHKHYVHGNKMQPKHIGKKCNLSILGTIWASATATFAF